MRFRLARPADLAAGSRFVHPGLKMSAQVRAQIVDIWRDLLARGVNFVVFEDPALPYPDCIEALGTSAFLKSDFFEGLLRRPKPYVSALVFEEVLAGRPPLLTQAEVRSANSDEGLHLLSLHFALRNPDLTQPRTRELLALANEAFFFFFGGYRINSAVAEVYGREQADYMQAGGFYLYEDFAGDFTSPEGPPPAAEHPYLFLLRKEDVRPSAANPLSFLFYPLAPSIYFSPAEQKLLERALLNESDDETAQGLGVSLDTVKKTWRRIYERVAREAPQVLSGTNPQFVRTARGSEKRRHLLQYLRGHLEELRPNTRGHVPAK
jgi:hypothetical protein